MVEQMKVNDSSCPAPRRFLSCRKLDAEGEPTPIETTPELVEQSRRYALAWKEMFGRFPQGQHPLKFPVNKQVSLAEADVILEFPVTPVNPP